MRAKTGVPLVDPTRWRTAVYGNDCGEQACCAERMMGHHREAWVDERWGRGGAGWSRTRGRRRSARG